MMMSVHNRYTPEELEQHRAAKELLVKEAERLQHSTEWKDTAQRLKDMQQEWRDIGPVPAEVSEALMLRFRSACDHFFGKRTLFLQNQELERIDNLYRKIELCERSEALVSKDDPVEAMEESKQLMLDWKGIGPVPREKSDALWERFKSTQDAVYQKFRVYLDAKDLERDENLKMKTKLCEEVEFISGKDDFAEYSQRIIEIQDEFKNIGHVPKEHADAVWNRFRAACDMFFERKGTMHQQYEADRNTNLEIRERLLAEALVLKEALDWSVATERFKALQEEWKVAWPVPKEHQERLKDGFREACDHFFERKRIFFEEKKKQWQKNQAVWRANMEKVISRKEEEITRLEAAREFDRNHLAEWMLRMEKLPAELKSIDLKMEIEEKIEQTKGSIERKEAMISQLQVDIEEIRNKLAQE
jgi:hypothetical protein